MRHLAQVSWLWVALAGGRHAFPHRVGSPPGRAKPHDEAALSRDGI